MKAELITRFKDITPEGGVIELVVWRVPQPVSPSTHDYRYRAAYVVSGVRAVGFDYRAARAIIATLRAVNDLMPSRQ